MEEAVLDLRERLLHLLNLLAGKSRDNDKVKAQIWEKAERQLRTSNAFCLHCSIACVVVGGIVGGVVGYFVGRNKKR